MTPEMLRAEAEECRKSSVGNGEYNTPFWVAAIVLENLAKRIEDSQALIPTPGEPDHG
jgi:hypothetical protein